MRACQPPHPADRGKRLPRLWLITDARNDARLERTLARLPRGSGLIFRHYHLAGPDREARFRELVRRCRRRGVMAVWAGSAAQARRAGADGCFGPPALLARGPALPRLATAHSLAEIAAARRARADLILLSPVFPTRSHPGAGTLGPVRFGLVADRAGVPVLALGGMTLKGARSLKPHGWAAIDGLTQ